MDLLNFSNGRETNGGGSGNSSSSSSNRNEATGGIHRDTRPKLVLNSLEFADGSVQIFWIDDETWVAGSPNVVASNSIIDVELGLLTSLIGVTVAFTLSRHGEVAQERRSYRELGELMQNRMVGWSARLEEW